MKKKEQNIRPKKATEGQKKTAKKIRVNLKNYKATNNSIVTAVFSFRIVMILFLIFYPILTALTSTYDLGVKSLLLYTLVDAPNWINSIFKIGGSANTVEGLSRLVPFLVWLIFGALVFLGYFIPFFNSRKKGGKGFLSFYFMLCGLIGFGLIYGFQFYLIKLFPHNAVDTTNPAVTDWKSLYWNDLNNHYRFDSTWMIGQQIFHSISLVFGIWLAIESDLIRRQKLNYDDLVVNVNKENSLANKVLSGSLEFGNVPDENLKLSIAKLKQKMNLDMALQEERVRELQSTPEPQSNLEAIEAERKEREHNILQNELKEKE